MPLTPLTTARGSTGSTSSTSSTTSTTPTRRWLAPWLTRLVALWTLCQARGMLAWAALLRWGSRQGWRPPDEEPLALQIIPDAHETPLGSLGQKGLLLALAGASGEAGPPVGSEGTGWLGAVGWRVGLGWLGVRRRALALEVVGVNQPAPRRAFVVRATAPAALTEIEAQVRARYPRARIRRLGRAEDPWRLDPGEAVSLRELRCPGPRFLSLETFEDAGGLGGRSGAGAASAFAPQRPGAMRGTERHDPTLGILAAVADPPAGVRLITQLAVLPAPAHWSAGMERTAEEFSLARAREERQYARQRSTSAFTGTPTSVSGGASSWAPLIVVLVLLVVVVLLWRVLGSPPLAPLAAAVEAALAAFVARVFPSVHPLHPLHPIPLPLHSPSAHPGSSSLPTPRGPTPAPHPCNVAPGGARTTLRTTPTPSATPPLAGRGGGWGSLLIPANGRLSTTILALVVGVCAVGLLLTAMRRWMGAGRSGGIAGRGRRGWRPWGAPLPVYDPAVIARKTREPGFHARLRLVVIGPAGATPQERQQRWRERRRLLDRLEAAYQPYQVATGATFSPYTPWWRVAHGLPAAPTPSGLPARRRTRWARRLRHGWLTLSVSEVAALWRLPAGSTLGDLPGVRDQDVAHALLAPTVLVAPGSALAHAPTQAASRRVHTYQTDGNNLDDDPDDPDDPDGTPLQGNDGNAGSDGSYAILGVSQAQGRVVPVVAPPDLFSHHLLAVAKTGQGKSTLLQRLALLSLRSPLTDGPWDQAANPDHVDHVDHVDGAANTVAPIPSGDQWTPWTPGTPWNTRWEPVHDRPAPSSLETLWGTALPAPSVPSRPAATGRAAATPGSRLPRANAGWRGLLTSAGSVRARSLLAPSGAGGAARGVAALDAALQVPPKVPLDALREAAHAAPSPGLMLLDPQGDLLFDLLGAIPPARRADVILVDLADTDWPVGINPLDVTLGRDRDKAVENLLTILSNIWPRWWGPRMENALEFALKTLYAANEAFVAQDPLHGPDQQYSLLDVAPLLLDDGFHRRVLGQIEQGPYGADDALTRWWARYFAPLDHRMQLEIINPVLTKLAKFDSSRVARRIVGQGRSTLDLADVIREGRILLVNTARGVVGADTAALIGATILGLMAVTLEEQARTQRHVRRRTHILVDEFQTIPGVEYGTLLAELRKYGAAFALATQSLATFDALHEQSRALRERVMSNLDALFVFQVSAKDAQLLAPELDDAVTTLDLINLAPLQCYAKVALSGQRLPVFSLTLAPPQRGDPAVQEALRQASRRRVAPAPAEVIDARLRALSARHTAPDRLRQWVRGRHRPSEPSLIPPASSPTVSPTAAPVAPDGQGHPATAHELDVATADTPPTRRRRAFDRDDPTAPAAPAAPTEASGTRRPPRPALRPRPEQRPPPAPERSTPEHEAHEAHQAHEADAGDARDAPEDDAAGTSAPDLWSVVVAQRAAGHPSSSANAETSGDTGGGASPPASPSRAPAPRPAVRSFLRAQDLPVPYTREQRGPEAEDTPHRQDPRSNPTRERLAPAPPPSPAPPAGPAARPAAGPAPSDRSAPVATVEARNVVDARSSGTAGTAETAETAEDSEEHTELRSALQPVAEVYQPVADAYHPVADAVMAIPRVETAPDERWQTPSGDVSAGASDDTHDETPVHRKARGGRNRLRRASTTSEPDEAPDEATNHGADDTPHPTLPPPAAGLSGDGSTGQASTGQASTGQASRKGQEQ